MSKRATQLQYKGNCCDSCGLSVTEMLDRYGTFERMFEFHHVDPTSKDRQYERMMRQNLSRRQLDEMDKCVLLCRNCHGRLHAQNIRAQLTLSIDFLSRKVSQSVSGWATIDSVAKTIGFVTNERYTLHPCRVCFGNRADLFATLGEIRSKMFDWICQMKGIQELRVFRLRDNKLVFSMKNESPGDIAFHHLIQFPVLDIEYHQEDKPKEVVFLRNGFAILQSGEVHSKGVLSYTLNLRKDLIRDGVVDA
jgi:hypothetical protein